MIEQMETQQIPTVSGLAGYGPDTDRVTLVVNNLSRDLGRGECTPVGPPRPLGDFRYYQPWHPSAATVRLGDRRHGAAAEKKRLVW